MRAALLHLLRLLLLLLLPLARASAGAAGPALVAKCPRRAAGHRASTRMGDLLVDRGWYDWAAACYGEALGFNARFPMAYFGLGEVYAGLGNPRRALEMFQTASGLWAGYYDAHIRAGRLLDEAGEREAAHREFARVLEIRPEWPLAYEELAQHHVLHGEHGRAVAAYELGFANVNQSSPGLHYGLGKVHWLTGNFTACLAKEDTALAMTGGRFGMAHHVKGQCLEGLGRLDDAVESYRAAVAAEGDEYDHHRSLAEGLAKRRAPQAEVAAVWAAAARALPEDARVKAMKEQHELGLARGAGGVQAGAADV